MFNICVVWFMYPPCLYVLIKFSLGLIIPSQGKSDVPHMNIGFDTLLPWLNKLLRTASKCLVSACDNSSALSTLLCANGTIKKGSKWFSTDMVHMEIIGCARICTRYTLFT